MGRLDDAAKHKVVELRKAGLSFRKIKAVLELENIKVSAQAIYLYLRELQGRPPGRVRPVDAAGATQVQVQPGTFRESWRNVQLQNLTQRASQNPGCSAKQSSTNTDGKINSSRCGETRGGNQTEKETEENDIQIVSVTSLAQLSQQRVPTVSDAEAAHMSSTFPASGTFSRKRVTPSPAASVMLAARKRLLDKALSHRPKSFHQVASLLRKDLTSVQSSDLRSALAQPRPTYDLTTEKTCVESQPADNNSSQRFPTQRPGLSPRTFSAPRIGIRLPNRPLAPLASSAPGASLLRLQGDGARGNSRNERNQSPQQAVQDAGARGGLQNQIQSLGSEVRSLGLAVKMLVEQQCRLEREQSQQTQIQKQILNTLQSLNSKIVHSSIQQQGNKTPSPSALPSTSFSQDTFSYNQSTYSQSQQNFNTLDNLDALGTFKLPGLSSANMNGFPPCSRAETLSLTHTPTQTHQYTSGYPQQTNQSPITAYSQSFAPSYSQPHTQSFPTTEKSADFQVATFQDCSVSSQHTTHPSQDAQTIKVEGR